jgi:hypothetical protein
MKDRRDGTGETPVLRLDGTLGGGVIPSHRHAGGIGIGGDYCFNQGFVPVGIRAGDCPAQGFPPLLQFRLNRLLQLLGRFLQVNFSRNKVRRHRSNSGSGCN